MAPLSELVAPTAWQRLDFISDLHLHEGDPATFLDWQRYLSATPADAVFILGDLFEAWVGDDVLFEAPPTGTAMGAVNFEQQCAQVLRDSVARRPTYLMHGNRDFLIASAFFAHTGVLPLADPLLLQAFGARIAVCHGDALCTQDLPYMQWREMVRHPEWQQQTLAQPLAARRAFAKQIRAHQSQNSPEYPVLTDIHVPEAEALLQGLSASLLVHGHTHQPGRSAPTPHVSREVLSDWDSLATPPRAQVLRLDASGWHRLSVQEAIAPPA